MPHQGILDKKDRAGLQPGFFTRSEDPFPNSLPALQPPSSPKSLEGREIPLGSNSIKTPRRSGLHLTTNEILN